MFDLEKQIQIAAQKLNFTMGLPIDENLIRDSVKESWQRCKEFDCNCLAHKTKKVLTKEQLEKRICENDEMLQVIKPFFNLLDKTLAPSFDVLALAIADSEGYILDAKASTKVIKSLPSNYLLGSCHKEEFVGNSGLSTALVTKKPACFIYQEHYQKQLEKTISFGVPIFNCNDQLLGVIAVKTEDVSSVVLVFNLIKSIAEEINDQIKAKERKRSVNVWLNEKQDKFIISILEKLPIGICMYDYEGNLKFMNKQVEKSIGYSKADLLDNSAGTIRKILFTKECSEAFIMKVTNTKKDCLAIKEKCFRKDGTSIDINMDIFSLNQDDGQLKGTLVVIRDISLEKEVEKLQLFLRAFFESTNSGIMAIDNNFLITVVNRRAEELFKFKRKDVIGKDVRKMLEKCEAKDQVLANALQYKSRYKLHEGYYEIGEDKLTIMASSDVLYSKYGKPLGAMAVYEDITEIKRQQLMIQHQQKLAEVGQIASSIIHEIKNPLTTIGGFTQLIKAKLTPEQAKESEYLNIIYKEIERIKQILNTYLHMSRPRTQKLTSRCLNDLVKEISNLMSVHAQMNNITIENYFAENLPCCLIDSDQIKQVLLNFAQNAIQSIKNKGKLIFKTRYLPELLQARVDVIDTGEGMTEEQMKKLGTPFFTTKKEGTGLGLSVSYAIIAEHNGYVDISSCLGQGSRFSLFLPIE